MKPFARLLIAQVAVLVFTVVFVPMGGAAADITNSTLSATTSFSERSFRINTLTFSNNLQKFAGLQDTNVSAMAKSYFSKLSVDFDSPGKSIAFNDKLGFLYVRATDRDLDYIGHIIQRFNQIPPLIHVASRYFEAPKGTVAGFGNVLNTTNSTADVFTGILNKKDARIVLNSLGSRKDVKILGDPNVSDSSGHLVPLVPIIRTATNVVFQTNPGTTSDRYAYLNAFGWTVETNLVLDVVPTILPDGYTISLEIIPSEAGFYAHDKPSGGHFTTLTLWDNQTVVWGGLEKNFMPNYNAAAGMPDNDKELLVFITATIVDPAGNRVHSDDEMPFAQTGMPPQPPQPK